MERTANKINNILPYMTTRSQTFWGSAWRRLQKNKGAMAGLVMIVLAVFIALFAYFIAPDSSPFANRIILEIGGEKPGYTQSFLLVKKERAVQSTGVWDRAISGKQDVVDYIPISAWSRKGDSIVVEKYIDEGVTEPLTFH